MKTKGCSYQLPAGVLRMAGDTLFTIARTWKKPKCPSTDEWIKKVWHIYTMEYYSAIKETKLGYL